MPSHICFSNMQHFISLISLLDEDRQWFKSKVGLNAEQTPFIYLCNHADDPNGYMIIENANEDIRLPKIRWLRVIQYSFLWAFRFAQMVSH